MLYFILKPVYLLWEVGINLWEEDGEDTKKDLQYFKEHVNEVEGKYELDQM